MNDDNLVDIYISQRSRRTLIGIWALAGAWWLAGLLAMAAGLDWARVPTMFATLITFFAFVTSSVILMRAAIATRKSGPGDL